jgi:hypothetical protein
MRYAAHADAGNDHIANRQKYPALRIVARIFHVAPVIKSLRHKVPHSPGRTRCREGDADEVASNGFSNAVRRR